MANMGCILPREGYLQRFARSRTQHGALFILDEVVTGFRYAPGGCQEYYSLKPDISTFGKALGAGFPIGAVAGRARFSTACVGATTWCCITARSTDTASP